jgi:hypothetical protein
MHKKFWLKILKGRDHSDNLGVREDNIKIDLREVGLEVVDWIDLTQGRDRWRAVVNTVMNLLVL